ARVWEGTYTLIRCLDAGPELQGYFLDACSVVMNHLNSDTAPEVIRSLVEHLVELFRLLDEPSLEAALGLWGELLVVAYGSDPVQLARAWHSNPRERFDFGSGRQRIEIKTATRLDGR